jgi:hypothetical protein
LVTVDKALVVLVERLFRAKAARRRALARLPIEDKIGILIQLQHMANGIRGTRKDVIRRPWHVSEEGRAGRKASR